MSILTPKGRFGSAALAAEAFGYTRQHAARLARASDSGFRYEYVRHYASKRSRKVSLLWTPIIVRPIPGSLWHEPLMARAA